MTKALHHRPNLLTRLLLVLTCVLVILAISTFLRNTTPPTGIVHKDGVTWQVTDSGIRVALFTTPLRLSTVWSNPTTLKETLKSQEYALAINGTFFAGSYEEATPAGFFHADGKTIRGIAHDEQLTRVVTYNEETNRLNFIGSDYFTEAMLPGAGFGFQTGPQVLTNNTVEKAEIARSLNGQGNYKRTLLGSTEDNQIFFVITTKVFTLPELGAQLMKMDIFNGKKISAVNLDGGPSVALATRNYPAINYNASQQLPLVIGTK